MLILMKKFPYSLHDWATPKCHIHFRNEMEVAQKPALVRFCVSCIMPDLFAVMDE